MLIEGGGGGYGGVGRDKDMCKMINSFICHLASLSGK